VIELDGRLAGYAVLFDRGAGRLMGDGYVHPEATGRGVGGMILRLTEQRARERMETADPACRVSLQNATLLHEGGDGARGLYETNGYIVVRHFWRMVADLDSEPERPLALEGVAVEPYDESRDARDVHATIQEAFRDHWGHREVSWDEWDAAWRAREAVDRTLWWVARAEGELAGVILASWKRMGDWGFVDTLGVRRPWRRRGVGEALLRTAMLEFWRRGERRVALGVDAESPTGATRLYERVGMRVFWRSVVWEKELRPGA